MPEEKSRETVIAEHISRYGLSTIDALRRMLFPGLSEKAVSRLTERLVESNWLKSRRLPGGGTYFKLGERAASELGLRPRQIASGGYQALVARLGVLCFCVKIGVQIYSSAKFRELYPKLCKPGFTASNYYRDKGEVNRLGFIYVDHGTTPERLVTKLRTRITRGYRDEDFAKHIQSGRCLFAIVTPTEEKAQAVRDKLSGQGPSPVHFRVEAVPELVPLLLESTPKKRRVKDA